MYYIALYILLTCVITLDSLQNDLDEAISEITDDEVESSIDDDSTDDSDTNELEQGDVTDEDFIPPEENASSEEGQYCKRSLHYDRFMGVVS